MINMPRPKPDQIIRHQIVFGEADRKILDRAIDSYTFNNFTRNAVALLNDPQGLAAFLAILAASGIIGASFVFKASPAAIAKGAADLVIDEFREAATEASLPLRTDHGAPVPSSAVPSRRLELPLSLSLASLKDAAAHT